MRISGIDVFPLRASISRPFSASVAVGRHTHRSALLVCIRTDEGLQGWGETDGPIETLGLAVKEVFEPVLLGQDPVATRALWNLLVHAAGPMRSGLSRAMSAVDMALWDLKGQCLGRPICELLGGVAGSRFPAVATAIFYPPQADDVNPRAELAGEYARAGFRGVKAKVGALSPSEDRRHIAAIREAIGPDVMLSVDANCAYGSRTAVSMAKELAELGVYWFEEPMPLEDVAGYQAVARASGMWTAGGQALPSAEAFLPLLEARGLHLIQPSIGVIGGFTELDRMVGTAQAFGARFSPPGWGTGVLIAASVHMRGASASAVASPFPDLDWIEYDLTDNPLRDAVLETPLLPEAGYLQVPEGPGLGVKVDIHAVRSLAEASQR